LNIRGITSPSRVVMDGGVPNLGDRSSTFMPWSVSCSVECMACGFSGSWAYSENIASTSSSVLSLMLLLPYPWGALTVAWVYHR